MEETLKYLTKRVNELEEQNKHLCNSNFGLKYENDKQKEQIENQAKIIRKQSEKIIPENIDLHNRINKTIEYLKDYKHEYHYGLVDKYEVLNRLEGDKDENIN